MGRLAGLERDLTIAEERYKTRLNAALKTCASGVWGLFGTNDAAHAASPLAASLRSFDAEELLTLGQSVGRLRERLGYVEAFALHERFLSYRRAAKDPNAPGEPKLARMFIEELEREEETKR
ncbi:MAG: hypothetical protein ABI431_07510 [Candidatus Tumulicola sp.]